MEAVMERLCRLGDKLVAVETEQQRRDFHKKKENISLEGKQIKKHYKKLQSEGTLRSIKFEYSSLLEEARFWYFKSKYFKAKESQRKALLTPCMRSMKKRTVPWSKRTMRLLEESFISKEKGFENLDSHRNVEKEMAVAEYENCELVVLNVLEEEEGIKDIQQSDEIIKDILQAKPKYEEVVGIVAFDCNSVENSLVSNKGEGIMEGSPVVNLPIGKVTQEIYITIIEKENPKKEHPQHCIWKEGALEYSPLYDLFIDGNEIVEVIGDIAILEEYSLADNIVAEEGDHLEDSLSGVDDCWDEIMVKDLLIEEEMALFDAVIMAETKRKTNYLLNRRKRSNASQNRSQGDQHQKMNWKKRRRFKFTELAF